MITNYDELLTNGGKLNHFQFLAFVSDKLTQKKLKFSFMIQTNFLYYPYATL